MLGKPLLTVTVQADWDQLSLNIAMACPLLLVSVNRLKISYTVVSVLIFAVGRPLSHF